MKIDTENDNVLSVELSLDSVRGYFEGSDLPEDLENALDEAQGAVFAGDHNKFFVVVEIKES